MTPDGAIRWLLLATHVPASGMGGGMVRYVVELARALQVRPDVELHVLAASRSKEFWCGELGDASRVGTLPGLPTPAVSVIERAGLVSSLRGRGVDVVHGAKHLIPRYTRAATLLTVHDMILIDRPEDFPWLKRTSLRAPYLGSVRDADAIACVSQATLARLIVAIPEARPKSSVILHAAPPGLLGLEPTEVPSLRGRRFVLVVGDPSPRKNLSLLIEAWHAIHATVPDAVLAIVGPQGWGTESYGKGLDDLVHAGAVQVLGHIDDSQLAWCYRNCRVVACPSIVEGAGIPAIEARAFAAPLVTSLDPALVEMSGTYAKHLSAHDPQAWASALGVMLTSPRKDVMIDSHVRSRTWSDVAAEHVALARRTLAADRS